MGTNTAKKPAWDITYNSKEKVGYEGMYKNIGDYIAEVETVKSTAKGDPMIVFRMKASSHGKGVNGLEYTSFAGLANTIEPPAQDVIDRNKRKLNDVMRALGAVDGESLTEMVGKRLVMRYTKNGPDAYASFHALSAYRGVAPADRVSQMQQTISEPVFDINDDDSVPF